MNAVSVSDIAQRFEENPLLTPKNIKPSSEGMVVESLLNPGVFRFDKKIWLFMRVDECPEQTKGIATIERHQAADTELLRCAKSDPHLDFSDPRVIHYKGNHYLTSLSHLRLMCSEDGRNFRDAENYDPIFGESELEDYGIQDGRVTEINGIFY